LHLREFYKGVSKEQSRKSTGTVLAARDAKANYSYSGASQLSLSKMNCIFLALCVLTSCASTAFAQGRVPRPIELSPPKPIIENTLRAARTIYLEPSEHLDSKYLEYKLGKYPEFEDWNLSIVRDRTKADLVLTVHRRMLNYIFSIEDPDTSKVLINGKVVAINDLVAAEEISKEIIKRMKSVRALPGN
jgi:hypothetical protein